MLKDVPSSHHLNAWQLNLNTQLTFCGAVSYGATNYNAMTENACCLQCRQRINTPHAHARANVTTR